MRAALLASLLSSGCYDLDAVPRPSTQNDAAGSDATGGDSLVDGSLDAYAQAVLADAPIAYWRLDEGGGAVAHDVLGGHDGTYAGGCVAGAPGVVLGNGAVDFDGCYILVDASPDLDFAEMAAFSVELWIYRQSWADEFAMAFVRAPTPFADGANPMIEEGYFMAIQHELGNFSRCHAGCETGDTTGLTLGSWHHVVAVYDGMAGDGSLRIHVDGSLGALATGNNALLSQDVPLYLGDPRAADPLVGRIDEIAIYDRALLLDRIVVHRAAADGI